MEERCALSLGEVGGDLPPPLSVTGKPHTSLCYHKKELLSQMRGVKNYSNLGLKFGAQLLPRRSALPAPGLGALFQGGLE